MVQQLRSVPIGVDAAEVRDIVAVLLEEPHCGVLAAEVEVATAVVAAGHHGAVVADLVRSPGVGALVEVGAAVGVVRLPGRIRGLEKHSGVARVIAHDEGDLAVVAVVGARELCDVDAGYRIGRHSPGSGDAPVSAVVQLGRRVGDAGRLALGKRGRRCHVRDLACAESLVVAGAEDLDRVRPRVRVDLETDRSADVHADVGGEALDVAVSSSLDVPHGRVRPGKRVLAHDRIRGGSAAGCGTRRRGTERHDEPGDKQDDHRGSGRRERRESIPLRPGTQIRVLSFPHI